MVEEFEFYRNVRSRYYNVSFLLTFTYQFSHRHSKQATARGSFQCGVNVHAQMIEYTMQLMSEPIERPYSEGGSFLFSNIYQGFPLQSIVLQNYPILKQRYRVPIDYDWEAYIVKGAESVMDKHTLGDLLKKYRFKSVNGEPVDANLKFSSVQIEW